MPSATRRAPLKPIRSDGKVVDHEEVIDDPGVSDKRLLVVESELASVLAPGNPRGTSRNRRRSVALGDPSPRSFGTSQPSDHRHRRVSVR